MNLLEFPITGLIVKPKNKTELHFLGEYESMYQGSEDAFRKLDLKFPITIKLIDFMFGKTVPQGRFLIGRYEEQQKDIYKICYYLNKQKNIQDYLLVSAHEEGHIIDHLDYKLELETLLQSKNVDIELKKIKNREVRADIAGLYVLDRENISFSKLSKHWLEERHVKDAIDIYTKAKF
jgi:hypothetical protein